MKEVFSILIFIVMILALNAAAYAEIPTDDSAIGFIGKRGTFTDSSFTDSHTADGGAIYAAGSDLVFTGIFIDSIGTGSGAISLE